VKGLPPGYTVLLFVTITLYTVIKAFIEVIRLLGRTH